MFVTRVKCPRCNGDHVCIEVIRSKIFKEGILFGAGWVTRDVHAYCYNCDEDELNNRALETAAEREMIAAQRIVEARPVADGAETQIEFVDTEITTTTCDVEPPATALEPSIRQMTSPHYRARNPHVQAFVEGTLAPALLKALDDGEDLLRKAQNWLAADGVKHWDNARWLYRDMQRRIVAMAIAENSLKFIKSGFYRLTEK